MRIGKKSGMMLEVPLIYAFGMVIYALALCAFKGYVQAVICMLAVPYIEDTVGFALVVMFSLVSLLLGNFLHHRERS